MVSFNRTIQAGNLTRDPELRVTNGGIPVCSFSIAVNRVRSKSDEVDYFDVTAWRDLGESVANYKKKGDPILVEGRLEYSTWNDKDTGQKRSKVQIVADNVQFLGRANGDDAQQSSQRPSGASQSAGDDDQARRRAEAQRKRDEARKALDEAEEEFEDIPF